jgi:peptide/nickel transport system permease protein
MADKLLGFSRRAAYYLLLLVLANLIMYGLVNMAPGSPLESAFSTAEQEEQLAEELGLADPFPVRFTKWFGKALTLDFGFSLELQLGTPVMDMVGLRFARTVMLVCFALLVSFLGSMLVSLVLRPDSPLGATLRPIVLVFSAIPAFLLGYWTIQGTNRLIHQWVEAGSLEPPFWYPLPSLEGGLVPYLFAAIALAIGDATLGDLLRGVDRELATLSGRRYVHAARARGASVVVHGAPEFSITAVGLFASRLVFLLGGVVIIEKIFNLEGAGELLWDAAEVRDYSVVVGISFLSTLLVIVALFIADLYQFLMDPRVTR